MKLPGWIGDLLQQLALEAPTDRPVRVRLGSLRGMFGECSQGRGCYVIRLHSTLPRSIMRETLLHEWAHAMTWHEERHHGAAWGVNYARLLTLVFD